MVLDVSLPLSTMFAFGVPMILFSHTSGQVEETSQLRHFSALIPSLPTCHCPSSFAPPCRLKGPEAEYPTNAMFNVFPPYVLLLHHSYTSQ